jgi:hypothetical protein
MEDEGMSSLTKNLSGSVSICGSGTYREHRKNLGVVQEISSPGLALDAHGIGWVGSFRPVLVLVSVVLCLNQRPCALVGGDSGE